MTATNSKSSNDPLTEDPDYHNATLKSNTRITASDWFQDVRHLEFTFDEDIQCVSVHSDMPAGA